MNTKTQTKLDSFTLAYIEAALWSSTEYAFGECPCCGESAILSHYPEPEFEQVPMCSAEGCGVKEIANPDHMDRNYGTKDLAPETLEKIISDCAKLQSENETPNYGGGEWTNEERAGHDFWLTRNGHGVGFWDRDELDEATQTRLTDASEAFGECTLYVGDDGKLYLS